MRLLCFFWTLLNLSSLQVSSVIGDTIAPGWCSIYDECGINPTLDNAELRGSVPCKNNVPAKDYDTASVFAQRLKAVCPEIVPDGKESVQVCCSNAQVQTLVDQLRASEIVFSRCPSCVHNFKNIICQNTCSPDQATFVNVTRFLGNKTLEYYAFWDKAYLDAAFDSCKDVIFPQTNGKAVELMCGGYSGSDCTIERWLAYIGTSNNGISPLDIKYAMFDNTTEPTAPPAPFVAHQTTMFSCTEAPYEGEEACSCTDCKAACPPPPPIDPTEPPFEIGDMDGVLVIVIIAFSAVTVTFVVYLLVCFFLKNRRGQSGNSIKNHPDEHPPVSEKEVSFFESWGKRSQDAIQEVFRTWGSFVARNPVWVIIVSTAIAAAMCGGVPLIEMTTDPIELWSAEGSKVRSEKDFYDENFGAFYRSQQVIMKLRDDLENDTQTYTSYTGEKYKFSAIFAKERLMQMLELQNRIRYLKAPFPEAMETLGRDYITLKDVCFKPLEPDNDNCTMMSVLNYWQNDPNELNKIAYFWDDVKKINYTLDYHDHFLYCVQSPNTPQDTTELKQNCLGDYGGPVLPYVAMGGFEDDEYHTSIALLLSFVVNNYPRDTLKFRMALAWEKEYLNIIQNWNNTNFTYAYFSERSVEDEIIRQSQADVIIFAGSYLAIFLYITIGLGTYSSFARIPVDSKMTLGLIGIIVILASVFASLGFYGYIGIESSLIVIEVVPFLVLAIGADNIFILTLEFQRDKRKPDETVDDQVGRVVGEVAPSMLLCSLTESVTFFLGALSDMPAVQEFALCAALAVLIDFILQMSVFVAVLTLDAKRQEASRADVLCCVKMKGKSKTPTRLQDIFTKFYAPALMNFAVRPIVLLSFFTLFCWCIYVCSNMTVGLDQDLSMPLDSYVLTYFDYMAKYLSVGVPVYFVTKGAYNFSDPQAGNLICASAGCDLYSMTQQISYASENPDYWQIATPATSWYDDYQAWLQPFVKGSCCRHHLGNETSFCPATDKESSCRSCLRIGKEETPDEFMQYLPWFLIDNPGVECNKGGHAAYGNAVSLGVNEDDQDVVLGSYFFAYHTICIKSTDCTNNLRMARKLSENITQTLKTAPGVPDDFEVFPYSVYYVYYDQYLTMVPETLLQLGVCLIPTFIFNFILLGFDLYSGLITVVTILMITVDTAGICSLWGVDLNAVSLINLVVAIGLSVEFTSHVVRAFSLSTKNGRKNRVIHAMGSMGPAVFAGVALTNLPGICVLAFAKSQLIQIFFFRMCLITTLLGMAHGLLFLPVFLSYFGPPVNKAILLDEQRKQKLKKQSILEKKGAVNDAYNGSLEMPDPSFQIPEKSDTPPESTQITEL